MSGPIAEGKREAPWRQVLIGLLAVVCGFLAFNFTHLMKTTHFHLSSHTTQHKSMAFCAFTGCKTGEPATLLDKAAAPWAHYSRAPCLQWRMLPRSSLLRICWLRRS